MQIQHCQHINVRFKTSCCDVRQADDLSMLNCKIVYSTVFVTLLVFLTLLYCTLGTMPRGRYNHISPTDRRRIVQAANNGGNWRQLAEQLGANHSTAWYEVGIREGRNKAKQKGKDAKSTLMNKSRLLLA